MKEIIWVFGTSASGKETFIRSLINDGRMRKLLDLQHKTITYSKESLKNLGKLDNSRVSIIDNVHALLEKKEVVLIKWQYGDTLLDTPNRLYDLFPKYNFRAVILKVSLPIQIERLKTKSWWHDSGKEEEYITKENLTVQNSVKALNDHFTIQNVAW